jgi:hypothetical protein
MLKRARIAVHDFIEHTFIYIHRNHNSYHCLRFLEEACSQAQIRCSARANPAFALDWHAIPPFALLEVHRKMLLPRAYVRSLALSGMPHSYAVCASIRPWGGRSHVGSFHSFSGKGALTFPTGVKRCASKAV